MMTTINLNQKKKNRKNEQQQIGRVSDLSDRSTEMAGCVGQVFSSCSTATNKHDKNKAIIHPPIRSKQDWLKRDLPLCIIDQNKFFSLQKESTKSKAGLPILATNQQSTGFASFCSLTCNWRGKGGAGGGEGEP